MKHAYMIRFVMLCMLLAVSIVNANGYGDNTQQNPSMGLGSGHNDNEQSNPSFGCKTKKGDVNGDGVITMADANAVVNYFLAADKSTVDINIEAADVNGDGSITMADANQIVNMFLGSAQ